MLKRRIALLLLFFSTFIFAQDKNALVKNLNDAYRSGKASNITTAAEKMGDYFIKENDDDSIAKYYLVAYKYATGNVQKAAAAFKTARAALFLDPALSIGIAKKGFEFVKDTLVIEKGGLCNVMGIYYSLNGQYDSSLYYYTIALNVAQTLKDSVLLCKVNSNFGDLYSYKGDYATALKYQFQSLELYEQRKDSALILQTTVNIGNTYNHMGNMDKALAFYNRVYPLLAEKETRLAGNLFNSMAVAYEDLHDTVKEQTLLLKSLKVKKALGDSVGICNTLINLGILENDRGNLVLARKYLMESQVIAKRINNPRLLRASGLDLGDICMKEKKYPEAIQFYADALELAKRDEDFDSERHALTRLYEVYAKLGDYKNAYDYLNQYLTVVQKINTTESAKQLAEAETKYQSQKKQRENEELQYQNKLKTIAKEKAEHDKQLVIYFAIAGLIGITLIFFLVYRNFRIRAKAKEEQKITKAIYESEQKERIRISRDLHDNVGTQLSLISNDIEWITHPLKTMTEQEKSNKLEVIGDLSKEVIATLRETIWALNKNEVSFEEFSDKLKAHVQKQVQVSRHVNPIFHEELECTIQLGPSEALGLFRICQEAVANSLKYAAADSMQVDLFARDGKYRVTISDKGKGFDLSEVASNNKYGIENMRYRATQIGCRLEIVAVPGNGTNISISKE